MKSAVESLNRSKQQPCDEFETFGKYLASEVRSLDDIAMARRIKLKLSRFFLDVLEQEQNCGSIVILENIALDAFDPNVNENIDPNVNTH